jgi:hypothetical protein
MQLGRPGIVATSLADRSVRLGINETGITVRGAGIAPAVTGV